MPPPRNESMKTRANDRATPRGRGCGSVNENVHANVPIHSYFHVDGDAHPNDRANGDANVRESVRDDET